MQTVYLANPFGFSNLTIVALEQIKLKLEEHFKVVEPFTENDESGQKINELLEKETDIRILKEKLKILNREIGKRNAGFIDNSDIIIAILDGPEVDSGVAAEVGYAYGRGKTVHGIREDFRSGGDNLGSMINLQVEYFVEESGGKVHSSLDSLLKSVT
ncbi:MAG: nucleoside 2-deoxyribosyltransferase [Candidatus Hodarchaeota archaeon]